MPALRANCDEQIVQAQGLDVTHLPKLDGQLNEEHRSAYPDKEFLG